MDGAGHCHQRHHADNLVIRDFGIVRALAGTGIVGRSRYAAPGSLLSYTFDVTRSYVPVLWAFIPLCALASILFLSLG